MTEGCILSNYCWGNIEVGNILYICDYAAKYSGNFVASLSKLAAMADEKRKVYFLFPEKARDMPWVKNLPVSDDRLFFCDFSVKQLAKECSRLASFLRSEETIVHTHFVADLNLLAVRCAFKNVICHYHMMVPQNTTRMKKIKQLVRRFIYRNVILLGVSSAVTEDLKRYFISDKCLCIPNAIDFARLDRELPPPECHKGRFPQETFNILMHGTDFFRKGVDLTAKAVENLNVNKGLRCKLFVTSHNIEEGNQHLRSIGVNPEYVEMIDVVENVKWLYDNVDLFVSPSRNEAFGYAVVEASYADCQVAASDVPGQDTMKGIPGVFWMERDSVTDMEAAILAAMSNKNADNLTELKKEQQRYVKNVFSLEQWANHVLEVYASDLL